MKGINTIIIGLMVCLIVLLLYSLAQTLVVKYKIAEIEARGIESCYMVNCDATLLGGVNCYVEHVPDLDIEGIGGWNETLGIG